MSELYHYGVLGMKWGVRKNNRKLERIKRKANRRGWDSDAENAAVTRTKSIKQMSNAELRKLNERTQLERTYSQLNPKSISKGWSYVVKAGAVMGTALTIYNNSNTIVNIGKNIGGKILDVSGNMILKDLAKGLR